MRIVVLDQENFLSDLPLHDLACEWVTYPKTEAYQVVSRLQQADIAVTHRIKLDEAILRQLPLLKMVTTNSTGYETVDVATCTALGICVCNVQDWCTNSVVEHIVSFIFSLNRRQLAYHHAIQHQEWVPQTASSYALLQPVPQEVAGSTLGIIGYGTLGRQLAATGSKLGMKPLIAERKGRTSARVGYTLFEEVLTTSDFLVLLVPLTAETHYLLGATELARMKSSAFLINCGRGGLVEETALLQALASNQIAGAGLDVLEEEPPALDHPLVSYQGHNLVLSSHVAFASQQSIARNSALIMENIRQFLNGTPVNVVN